MQSKTLVAARTRRRPQRLLIFLAALWLVLSLAVGTAMSAEPDANASSALTAIVV